MSKDLLGCSTARNKGTCGNRMNIRRDALEARVLNALRTRLVNPTSSPSSATPIRGRPTGCAWKVAPASTRPRPS
uniref:recombinase zinc beta ribbon domain-containing protein n=1 Tax=Paracoccus versutus TaxID=34007 RepID=UPI0035A57E0F